MGKSGEHQTKAIASLRTRRFGPVTLSLLVASLFAFPSFSNASVTTHGGPVESTPHIYELFWGSAWNSEPAASERSTLKTMFEEIPGSSWQGILTQYWGPGGFISSEVTHGIPYTDERVSAPSGLNVESVRTEVREAIKANEKNGWPKAPTSNDQFVIFVPPGTGYSSEAEHRN